MSIALSVDALEGHKEVMVPQMTGSLHIGRLSIILASLTTRDLRESRNRKRAVSGNDPLEIFLSR